MGGYATGGYIASGQPVHLDDDECVVHEGPGGWYCTRLLHTGQPCQSPSPTPTPSDSTASPNVSTTRGQNDHDGHHVQGEGHTHPGLPHPTASPSAPHTHGHTAGDDRAAGAGSPQPPDSRTA